MSFHVPGHKNGRGYIKDSFQLHLGLDVTEIPGTDNLHSPSGPILKAQERACKFYGAHKTYFLVNGTTCGIQAMILAATEPKDKVLICRNAHKSVYDACIIGDLSPVYVYPEIESQRGIPLGISSKQIKACLDKEGPVSAVVITSPSYEGIHCDIEAIAQVVHRQGGILLVDEAHGAHLPLHRALGKSALSQGADLVAQSTHKTLSALTQASMLHVGSNRVSIEKLEKWLSILQSSSPSYLLMLSLEKAIEDASKLGKERMEMILESIESFRSRPILNKFILNRSVVAQKGYDLDPTKLVIFSENGPKMAFRLKKEYGIQIEYALKNYLVCVASLWNCPSDFDRLANALENMKEKLQSSPQKSALPFEVTSIMTPRNAFFSKRKAVSIKNALGEVSVEPIIPYPPGIPIVVPGEVFTKTHLEYIMYCKRMGIEVVGLKDKTLKSILVATV